MDIDQGNPDDVPGVMALITLCVAEMRSQGIFQWDEQYPSLEVVEADARRGALFVARRDGQCIGTICLDDIQPEQYRGLGWQGTDHALVIHRLCVHPEHRGEGIARALMEFAERSAREQGYGAVRLDAFSGNPRALAFYKKRGYQYVGQGYFPRRQLPFHCFELVLA